MSSGTHSNLQSNSPPPRRGRRITRSREPTSDLHAASSEVPGILTGLLGSSPPRSRAESNSSVDHGDFWHPTAHVSSAARDHLPAVYDDETGDIPIGFDISHLLNRGRLPPARIEDSSNIINGFDITDLLSRSRLTPAYSEASGDIPVAWILFNPLAGTLAFRRDEAETVYGPNPYVSIEELENELQADPGTFQEWQDTRAEDFYAEHRLRHQERVAEWREERIRRATAISHGATDRGANVDHAVGSTGSHHAASDAEAQPRTATEDPSQSNELTEADRQRLINWLRSRARQRQVAREAQEAADHAFAVDLQLNSSTDVQPSAATSSLYAQPTSSTTSTIAQPHTPASSSSTQDLPATSTSARPTPPAAPFILPPEPQPNFLTSLNSYRYHLGTILLQPIPEEEFDEEEVRAMVNDPDIHGWLRVLAYGRRRT
ncbi:hypothetical protein HII31_10519 [Pseudocercospora fuligena]|uniref:Uncharacterized protein n=1 Tax=Pseudocercospora fuligena TaxID=685502 RepID=A0A8H6VHF9_9PEZI|nr:hypothetical protein HII31_10519 [Pseudocercospora fuligena]